MTQENLYVLLRWGFFVSLMLTTGGASYVAFLASGAFSGYLAQRMRPLLPFVVVGTLLMSVSILLLQHQMMSGDVRALIRPDMWFAVLSTSSGRGWGIQVLLALLAVLLSLLPGRRAYRALGIMVILQWCAMTLIGHAAAQDGLWGSVQRINHLLHLLTAALWAGGLPPLLWVMAESKREIWRHAAISTMLRFSRYGHCWVALNLLSGAANAGFIVGWPPSMGLYSALLLAKVCLVGVMMGLALYNRYVLVPRLATEQGERAERQLIRHIWLAIGLSALVLLLVSLFATLSPYSE